MIFFGYWQAICYYYFMIQVIIRMKALSDKRMELSQTIAFLSGSIRMEPGCRRCDFCQSIEDENRLFLLEEWDTQENLMTHLQSEHFRVLRGAMYLLKEPCERTFHTVFHPAGMEEIYANLPLPENYHLKKNSSAVKSKFQRRNTMKSSTKDQAEGKFHKVKGKIKEIAGELSDNPKLEAEGAGEKIAGIVQEKIGQVKKVLGK
jgi:uncharacterized protein YjbJ (UPF0337 family)/quinol monooxygenase YgiN